MHKALTSGLRSSRISLLVVAALPSVFGCSLDVAPEFNDVAAPTIQITVLSGDNQNVPAGGSFPQPVRVQVLRNGGPYSGIVNYSLTTPAPPVTFSAVTSDAQGIASIRPTAGTAQGPFTLRIFYAHCQRPGFAGCSVPFQELGAVTVNGTIVAAS